MQINFYVQWWHIQCAAWSRSQGREPFTTEMGEALWRRSQARFEARQAAGLPLEEQKKKKYIYIYIYINLFAYLFLFVYFCLNLFI